MKILELERSPLLLTILFSLIGLQYNYLVNSFANSPSIEYKFHILKETRASNGHNQEIACDINNISNSLAFQHLDLTDEHFHSYCRMSSRV